MIERTVEILEIRADFLTIKLVNQRAGHAEQPRIGPGLVTRHHYRMRLATVEATEEAILNAMLAARDMTGVGGVKVFALPHEEVRSAMRRYGLMR